MNGARVSMSGSSCGAYRSQRDMERGLIGSVTVEKLGVEI
jgi:hypothetical protein